MPAKGFAVEYGIKMNAARISVLFEPSGESGVYGVPGSRPAAHKELTEMDRFKLALAGLAAACAALTTPLPASADHFGHAHHWMAQRFGHAAPRPDFRGGTPVRRAVVQRPSYPAYERRPAVRRVAYRAPAYYPRRSVRRVAHRPYQVVYYRPVVRTIYVVPRPVFTTSIFIP
jgi:hypothetical protein